MSEDLLEYVSKLNLSGLVNLHEWVSKLTCLG